MYKYVLKRIGLMIITFFIITFICFVLVKLLPDPIRAVTKEQIELEKARRALMGYGKPIPEQFFMYIRNALQGNFGVSWRIKYNVDVIDMIGEKLPHTMILNVYSLLFSVPLGIGFGIFAALRKNKWQDHVLSVGVILAVSVPSYVYAFIIQYFLAFKWDIFPLEYAPGTDYFSWEMIHGAILPVLALSLSSIAGLTRFTRAELTEVLTSEFMLLARTKGLSKRQATMRHALRNSMVPIFPMIIAEFVSIIMGSLIIEKIFSVPGIGSLFIDSIHAPDFDVFITLGAFYTLIGLGSSILIDLSYGFIDPRIRIGGRK